MTIHSSLIKPIECRGEAYLPEVTMNQKDSSCANEKDVSTSKHIHLPDNNFPQQKKNLKEGNIYEDIECAGNKWMAMACTSALKSVENGGGPFSAVILQIDDESNEVLRYWNASNSVTKSTDPTAHAEIMAIRSACASLGVFNLGIIHRKESLLAQKGKISHCEIYSSCEPCPMCYSAIYWARVPNIYFAATRFDAAAPGVNFSDSEIYHELNIPYKNRKTRVRQCSTPNSLDAFNLWKSIEKEEY